MERNEAADEQQSKAGMTEIGIASATLQRLIARYNELRELERMVLKGFAICCIQLHLLASYITHHH